MDALTFAGIMCLCFAAGLGTYHYLFPNLTRAGRLAVALVVGAAIYFAGYALTPARALPMQSTPSPITTQEHP